MTIAELEALLAKATPGPWSSERDGLIYASDDELVVDAFDTGDAAAIVALMNAAPRLIAVVEAARAMAKAYERPIWGRSGHECDSAEHQTLEDALAALEEK